MNINDNLYKIIESIEKYTSVDKQAFLDAHQSEPHISIKINPNKIFDLKQLDFETADAVKWAKDAYFLNSRPAFYSDPLFYAGAYYVMDSSSMFLEYLLNSITLPENATVLDIAAAPGGKSVLISNYLNENGILISNEINHKRANILQYNLAKWGKSNYLVTNLASEKFQHISNTFDLVVCDAPCSGSGLFRKYPEWMNTFNEQLVEQCAIRQKQILQNIFSSVKEGGYLIYSTCSFMSEENEEIAKFIIHNGFEYVDISVPGDFGVIKTKYGLRFFPHLTKGEGFFYAVFQKTQPVTTLTRIGKQSFRYDSFPEPVKNNQFIPFTDYFNLKGNHQVFKYRNQYFLSNKNLLNVLEQMPLKFLSVGTLIGQINAHIPSAESALSLYLNPHIPQLELNKQQAQIFLKKDPLKISAEKKLYLITYKQLGLSWAKVLENRLNNYFPSEWRILKEIEIN